MVVPFSNLLAIMITLCVTTLLPFVFWFFCSQKSTGTLKPFLGGMSAYFVIELLIRIPILNFLVLIGLYDALGNLTVFVAMVMSGTAAFMEMFSRYLVFRWLTKRNPSYYGSMAIGIGFAGTESIALTALNYVSYMTVAMLLNNGFAENIENLETVKEMLIDPAWTDFIYTAVERALVMVIQVALTVILGWYVANRNTKIGFCVCTAAQFVYLYMAQILNQYVSMWITAAFLAVYAAVAVYAMLRVKSGFRLIQIPRDPNARR